MAEEVGVSDAIRAALQQFGNEAGKETTNKLKAWVKENYPHLSDKVDTTTFASTLSSLRKKARGGSEGATQTTTQTTTTPDDATLFQQTDEAQKKLTEQAGGDAPKPAPVVQAQAHTAPVFDMSVFVATVKELQRLAVKVGGKEQLKKLMDLL